MISCCSGRYLTKSVGSGDDLDPEVTKLLNALSRSGLSEDKKRELAVIALKV